MVERPLPVAERRLGRTGQRQSEATPGAPLGLGDHWKDRFADRDDLGEVHGVEMKPGAMEPQRLRAVFVSILRGELDAGLEFSKHLAPLSEKQEAPGQVELTQPVRKAQIRLLLRVSQDNRALLHRGLPRDAVFGRDPLDKVAVKKMGGEHAALAREANLSERLLA